MNGIYSNGQLFLRLSWLPSSSESFDLVGAIYSALMLNGFEPALLIMFVAVGVVLASYFLWHERQKGSVAGPVTGPH